MSLYAWLYAWLVQTNGYEKDPLQLWSLVAKFFADVAPRCAEDQPSVHYPVRARLSSSSSSASSPEFLAAIKDVQHFIRPTPNAAHFALAEIGNLLREKHKTQTILTQARLFLRIFPPHFSPCLQPPPV